MQDLFKQFDDLKDVDDVPAMEEKQRLIGAVCLELTLHMTLEEEIFYPAVRAMLDEEDMMNEAEVEHAGAKSLIDELGGMRPDDEMCNAKVKVLAEYIEHHIMDEHSEMFRKARDADLDLLALGQQIAARKRELSDVAQPVFQQPHGKKKSSQKRK